MSARVESFYPLARNSNEQINELVEIGNQIRGGIHGSLEERLEKIRGTIFNLSQLLEGENTQILLRDNLYRDNPENIRKLQKEQTLERLAADLLLNRNHEEATALKEIIAKLRVEHLVTAKKEGSSFESVEVSSPYVVYIEDIVERVKTLWKKYKESENKERDKDNYLTLMQVTRDVAEKSFISQKKEVESFFNKQWNPQLPEEQRRKTLKNKAQKIRALNQAEIQSLREMDRWIDKIQTESITCGERCNDCLGDFLCSCIICLGTCGMVSLHDIED